MTLHLVTGHAGKVHVTAAEQGQFNAYTLGSGTYIVHGCEASVANENSVLIGEGTILAQGRHVNIKDGGDYVVIQNGTVNEFRRDLICLKYQMNTESGLESMSLEVVQGTSGTEYVAPTLPEQSILAGDNPCLIGLYTVDIMPDLTVGNIQRVCEQHKAYFDSEAEIKGIQEDVHSTYSTFQADVEGVKTEFKAYIDTELGIIAEGSY